VSAGSGGLSTRAVGILGGAGFAKPSRISFIPWLAVGRKERDVVGTSVTGSGRGGTGSDVMGWRGRTGCGGARRVFVVEEPKSANRKVAREAKAGISGVVRDGPATRGVLDERDRCEAPPAVIAFEELGAACKEGAAFALAAADTRRSNDAGSALFGSDLRRKGFFNVVVLIAKDGAHCMGVVEMLSHFRRALTISTTGAISFAAMAASGFI
jgi:hypothetical protein